MMKLQATIWLIALSMLFGRSYGQINIIPKPAEVKILSTDSLFITSKTVIVMQNENLKPSVDFLKDYLNRFYGTSLKIRKKEGKDLYIKLGISKDVQAKSGAYTMNVSKDGITILGFDEPGVFYGMQTLLQLLPLNDTRIKIPAVEIKDAPQYEYRGMMLDVCRHFFPVEFVKKYIDFLAFHKMNYFHWHLTEDQGWRIEIKKYPNLTKVAAFRDSTIIGRTSQYDGKRYGGYYTQEQIKEIVTYATKRYITVVPEIEMPGHSSAALTAYPSLGCTGGPYKVRQMWGISKDVYCAGNDSVFTFLQDVLDEVMALFPSKYIHIGGDECPKDRWKECPKCQQRMKDNHLQNEQELQSYFVQRIEKYLNSKGRVLIGWDEILEGGLAPNAVVMSWRGEKGGIEAAKQKHAVIMTPNSYLYFDHYQAKQTEEPLAIGGYTNLEKVYSYNPVSDQLGSEEAQFIKGVQANLWTEYIPTTEQAEYMAMPRMAALSEVAWTQPQLKDWNDFKKRMDRQYQLFEKWNINYSKSAFDVRQTVTLESVLSKATVELKTDSYTQIHYTIDGSEPDANSALYSKPFEVRRTSTIKAATFKEGKRVGRISAQQVVIN